MKTFLSLLVVLVCASTFAKWSKIDASEFVVAPPPARGSQIDQEDMTTLLELQVARTEEQCAEVQAAKSANFKSLFKGSSILSEPEYLRLKPLMRNVSKTAFDISHTFKDRFRRPRPRVEDSRIQPCPGASSSRPGFSYPSSHAAVGTTLSCVLAYAYPARAAAFTAYGERIGELRVIGGFHHPSDILAGEKLGADICQHLLQDKGFLKKLKAAAL